MFSHLPLYFSKIAYYADCFALGIFSFYVLKNFKNNHQRLEMQSVASTQMAKKWEGAESKKIFDTKMRKKRVKTQGQ